MTRQQAIEIAAQAAKDFPERYYAEPFVPHEWVIQAIFRATNPVRGLAKTKQAFQTMWMERGEKGFC